MGEARYLDFLEMRQQAKRRLPRAIFDYIDRGTEAETALLALRNAFDRRRVVQRALLDVTRPDISVNILGKAYPRPFIIAPTALAGLVRYNGELEITKGAGDADLPYCAATQASTRIEDIAQASSQTDLWFQLYPWRDRSQTLLLLDRAAAQGIEILLVTVDTPGPIKKIHNTRNGFTIPLKPNLKLALDIAIHPSWCFGVMGRYLATRGMPSFENYPGTVRTAITRSITDPRFALETDFGPVTIKAIRDYWKGKLIIKGIQHPQDAETALALGADGVVVSSHGGRNIDSLASPLKVLPDIRAAVGGKMTILADSGVQRGSDIAKLIGAGADAVLAGRAFLWALAAEGRSGVQHMTEMLSDELRSFMAFAGAQRLDDLRKAHWIDE